MSSIHESLLTIVKERRSGYTKSVRLLFLSFATLVAFQFLIFNPYVAAQTRLIEVKAEQASYASISGNLEKRQRAYSKIGEEIKQEVERRLEAMIADIAADLGTLTDAVIPFLREDLRTEILDKRDLDRQFNMGIQAGPPPPPLPTVEIELDRETIAAVRRAGGWSEIREILQPEILSKIIDVRFSEYNESIQSFVEVALSGVVQASSWKPKGLGSLSEELQDLWAQVEKASEEAIQKMRSLGIDKPEDERWWWSAAGKQVVSGLEMSRSGNLLDALLEEAGYDALLASLGSQLQVLAAAEKTVVARQAEVAASFEAFQTTIAQLLGPLDWLPLNLNDFVFLMPLFVACSLGCGVAWALRKRDAYIRVLDTAMDRSEEVRELGFTLALENSVVKLQWWVLLGFVVGMFWIGHSNFQLSDFATLKAADQRAAIAGGISYTFLLNWVLSMALLLGGLVVSFGSLKSAPGSVE